MKKIKILLLTDLCPLLIVTTLKTLIIISENG